MFFVVFFTENFPTIIILIVLIFYKTLCYPTNSSSVNNLEIEGKATFYQWKHWKYGEGESKPAMEFRNSGNYGGGFLIGFDHSIPSNKNLSLIANCSYNGFRKDRLVSVPPSSRCVPLDGSDRIFILYDDLENNMSFSFHEVIAEFLWNFKYNKNRFFLGPSYCYLGDNHSAYIRTIMNQNDVMKLNEKINSYLYGAKFGDEFFINLLNHWFLSFNGAIYLFYAHSDLRAFQGTTVSPTFYVSNQKNGFQTKLHGEVDVLWKGEKICFQVGAMWESWLLYPYVRNPTQADDHPASIKRGNSNSYSIVFVVTFPFRN